MFIGVLDMILVCMEGLKGGCFFVINLVGAFVFPGSRLLGGWGGCFEFNLGLDVCGSEDFQELGWRVIDARWLE